MGNFNNNNNNSKKFLKIIKSKKFKLAISIALFATSLGILVYFCVENDNLVKLFEILPHLNFFWLFTAFFSMVLSWYFDSRIIDEIASLIYYKKHSKLFFFKVTMTGQYFSSITPLGVAAQPMQVVELYKNNIPKNIALIIMTRRFFVYQTTFAIYLLTVSILYFNYLKDFCPELIIFLLIGIAFQCFVVFLILLFTINKKLILSIIKIILIILSKMKIIKNYNKILTAAESQLEFFVRSNKYVKKNKKANFKLYFYAFLEITFLFLVPFFVYKSFNHSEMPVFGIVCTQSIVNTVSSFTPLPGSAGTAEKGFLTLFGSFFLSGEIAMAMLICRFITFYLNIILGAIFYKAPSKHQKNDRKKTTEKY